MSHGRATAAEEGASRWRAAAGAPSFVLLMPDDFPLNFLGAPHGLTPTLDRLRATGVNFARAYTTAPLCSRQAKGSHRHRVCRDGPGHRQSWRPMKASRELTGPWRAHA